MRLLPPFLASFVLLLACAPSASAVETMRLVDPITDNYKASFNADPSVPEKRTWLALRDVRAAGTTWRPSEPAAISFEAGAFTVHAADGRSGTLALSSVSGPIDARSVRIDPTSADSGGRWGPLITIRDRSLLRAGPILLNLTLTVDGSTVALGRVTYRYDAALAGVAAGHLEYNGPAGRWWAGATRTRTEWESTPATLPSPFAAFPPRITSVIVPAISERRVITMRARGVRGTARITHLRVSINGRRYGRWVRTAASYSVVLPGSGRHSVRVQMRDALGLVSGPVTRRVRVS